MKLYYVKIKSSDMLEPDLYIQHFGENEEDVVSKINVKLPKVYDNEYLKENFHIFETLPEGEVNTIC